MYEWYLSNGICLTGKEAEDYLVKRLDTFKDLSENIESIIDECKSLNSIEEETESLSWSVMETSERLASIQILLEMLLEDIISKL